MVAGSVGFLKRYTTKEFIDLPVQVVWHQPQSAASDAQAWAGNAAVQVKQGSASHATAMQVRAALPEPRMQQRFEPQLLRPLFFLHLPSSSPQARWPIGFAGDLARSWRPPLFEASQVFLRRLWSWCCVTSRLSQGATKTGVTKSWQLCMLSRHRGSGLRFTLPGACWRRIDQASGCP